jgi:hypothetical protein
MPTYAELLSDKTKYPDDTKFTLADGVETTLGELRSGSMMRADYTRKTQEAAREREAFAKEKADFETAKTAAEAELAQLAEKIVAQRDARGLDTSQQQLEELLQRDPVAKSLRDDIVGLRKTVEELSTVTKTQQEQLRQQQLAVIADQHRRALALAAQQHKLEFGEDLDTTAVVRFAQENGIPRVDLAYRLMTESQRTESALKKAKEAASTAAYEKAKRELAAPALPQRRVIQTTLDKEAPQTFDEAADRALQDPEILGYFNGSA